MKLSEFNEMYGLSCILFFIIMFIAAYTHNIKVIMVIVPIWAISGIIILIANIVDYFLW